METTWDSSLESICSRTMQECCTSSSSSSRVPAKPDSLPPPTSVADLSSGFPLLPPPASARLPDVASASARSEAVRRRLAEEEGGGALRRIVVLLRWLVDAKWEGGLENPTRRKEAVAACLRLMRNVCAVRGAGGAAAAAALLRMGSAKVLVDITLEGEEEEEEEEEEGERRGGVGLETAMSQKKRTNTVVSVPTLALQALANMCTALEEAREQLWELAFPDRLLRITQELRGGCWVGPLCNILHSCLADSPKRAHRMAESEAGGELFSRALAALVGDDQAHRNGGGGGGVGGEWVALLLMRCCIHHGFHRRVFAQLGCTETARALSRSSVPAGPPRRLVARLYEARETGETMYTDGCYYSPSQVRLLQVLGEAVADRSKREMVALQECGLPAQGQMRQQQRNRAELRVWAAMPGVAAVAHEAAERLVEAKGGGEEEDGTSVEILELSLGILRDLAAISEGDEGSYSPNNNTSITDEFRGVIRMLVHMLAALPPPQAALSEARIQEITGTFGGGGGGDGGVVGFPKLLPYQGYRTDIVGSLANIVFRRPHLQDVVRTEGGLEVILSNCTPDDENPLLREWSLFAIRNLTEGNSANQAAIKELELQDAASSCSLENIGLSVRLNSETQRPELVPRGS